MGTIFYTPNTPIIIRDESVPITKNSFGTFKDIIDAELVTKVPRVDIVAAADSGKPINGFHSRGRL